MTGRAPTPALADTVRLRGATPADAAVVRHAHVQHRCAALASLGWPQAMLERAGEQQYEAVQRHIASHHPAAERLAIEAGGETVGGLSLDRSGDCWLLVDIVLTDAAQGHGVGTAAIVLILNEARAAGVAVTLHVARDNPVAKRLYERLGFKAAPPDQATHDFLRWQAEA